MTSTAIQLASLDDLSDMERLEVECFGPAVAFSRRQLRYLLNSPAARVYVLRCEGALAGDAIFIRRRTMVGLVGRVYSVAVSGRFRGKGFGRLLMEKCLADLRAEGARAVTLEVDVENSPAIALYESLGFRKVERLAGYYAPGDAWKMILVLSEKKEQG